MSKMPEELEMFLRTFNIDPDSVEINIMAPENMLHKVVTGAKAAGSATKEMAHDMSDKAMVAHLAHNGVSKERIDEIMKEIETNRRAKEDELKKTKEQKRNMENNVVFLTMQTIAATYGYKLTDAHIEDDKPVAVVEAMNIVASKPIIVFTPQFGFHIVTHKMNSYMNEGMDIALRDMQNAVNCCKALNQIDWRTWPVK